MTKKDQRVQLVIDTELLEAARKAADKEDMSLSRWIRGAMKEQLMLVQVVQREAA